MSEFTHHDTKGLEKLISKFSVSYMSNSKWRKLFRALNIHQDHIQKCIINTLFEGGMIEELTFTDDFQEHLFETYMNNKITSDSVIWYKEILNLEFPKKWGGKQSGALLPPEIINQDTEMIKTKISSYGQFQWEDTDGSLFLLAYE
jgi:hypothetical protein